MCHIYHIYIYTYYIYINGTKHTAQTWKWWHDSCPQNKFAFGPPLKHQWFCSFHPLKLGLGLACFEPVGEPRDKKWWHQGHCMPSSSSFLDDHSGKPILIYIWFYNTYIYIYTYNNNYYYWFKKNYNYINPWGSCSPYYKINLWGS